MIVGEIGTVTLLVGSMASKLTRGRRFLAINMLVIELKITCYEVMHMSQHFVP